MVDSGGSDHFVNDEFISWLWQGMSEYNKMDQLKTYEAASSTNVFAIETGTISGHKINQSG